MHVNKHFIKTVRHTSVENDCVLRGVTNKWAIHSRVMGREIGQHLIHEDKG